MDAAEKRKQEASDIRAVMATVEGRRFVWNIIDGMAGVFGASYAGETQATAYNEGRRSLGIELMLRVQDAASADYMRALHEALTERQMAAEAKRTRARED